MLLLAMGCDRKDGISQKLDSIDRLCDSDPHLAISMLDSIHPAGISSKERHYYDLLTIKSRDKAYIRHTSDSLILDVIDYYSSHRKEGLYAQALYYGGRVYSDLGDLPTALEYFQNALDCKPEIDQNIQFKSAVLSQTGRLLLSLRLDSSAIAYLEKTLDFYNDIGDDYALAFTYELLGNAHLNAGDNQAALQDIAKAIRISACLSYDDRNSIEVSLAHILQTTGNLDSALNVIRNLPEKVDELTLSYSLATAAQIYRDANILDTCYMYARQLTLLKEPANRRTGYAVFFPMH